MEAEVGNTKQEEMGDFFFSYKLKAVNLRSVALHSQLKFRQVARDIVWLLIVSAWKLPIKVLGVSVAAKSGYNADFKG